MAVPEYSIVIFIFISEELSNSYSCKFFEHMIFRFYKIYKNEII